MPAPSVANKRKGKNSKEARRGRPRKPHLLPVTPVSRRSSLRTPRLHLREDFYNVDEIVVDDEDDEFRELEQLERPQEEEREEDDDDDDFRSNKKLKLLIKLHHHQIPTRRQTPTPTTTSKTRRRNGPSSLSSSDVDTNAIASVDRLRDRVNDEIGHQDRNSRHAAFSSGASMPWKETPLPDLKTVISILDKIQRKDKYAVFKNPVDPEELPDYHELIDHPMDFTTIRNKLTENLYSNLDEFESDVFLLCSNAMEYNPPETIYFKQARSMQELARKKFQTIRDEIQCCKIISNTNLMDHSNPIIIDKMLEDQTNSFSEEPHAMENQPDTVSDKPTEKSACSSPKGHDRSEISPSTDLATNTETISSDNKSLSIEEDRRSTYITSKNQQKRIIQMDPSFNTLDDEKKLVSVGLDEESSYARSLARFAASLGPTAWRIASEKIAKATPSGLKFGPGWVGEYESCLAPILSSNTESTNRHIPCYRNGGVNGMIPKPAVDDGKHALFGFRLGNKSQNESAMLRQLGDKITNTKHSSDDICNSNGVNSYFFPANLASSENHGFQDVVFNNRSFNPSKKVDEFAPLRDHSIMKSQGLLEGNISKKPSLDHRMNACLGFIPTIHADGKIENNFASLCGNNQKIDDPLEIIRMLPENVQSHPNSYYTATGKPMASSRNPFDGFGSATSAHSLMPTISCTGHRAMEGQGNSEVQIKSWSNSNRPTWMLQPSQGSLHSNDGLENIDRRKKQQCSQTETVLKPREMVRSGHGVLSKLERGNQSDHWHGLGSQAEERQGKNRVPPDLNIGFQSPSSPVQQQPDLALQL